MEVLISMFILAIGLMGVAALIPAGRHEIVEGMKLENAAMVGRSAFRDLQVRGYLNPAKWRQAPASNIPLFDPNAADKKNFSGWLPSGGQGSLYQAAFCIDPLGRTASPTVFVPKFPETAIDPVPLLRVVPFRTMSNVAAENRAAFDSIFRSSFDQVTDPNTANKDLPPTQKYFLDGGGLPARRASNGNYSWIATIVSDPSISISSINSPMNSALDTPVTVSVAVFYKRPLTKTTTGTPVPIGEYDVPVSFPAGMTMMTSGGEAILDTIDSVGRTVTVKPGQWIMLAGKIISQVQIMPLPNPPTPVNQYYYRWYRVLSAANPVGTAQSVTLAGQDWPNGQMVEQRAWIFDNIVSVYEKNMPLEIE